MFSSIVSYGSSMGVAVSGEGDRCSALAVADLALRVCARGELAASEAATRKPPNP